MYAVEARRVDVAGMPAPGAPPSTSRFPPPDGSGTGGGATTSISPASPSTGGRRATSGVASVDAHVLIVVPGRPQRRPNGLGHVVGGARVVAADARGVLARGTTNGGGRIVLTVPVRRSGSIALTANGGGPLIRVALRMRPLIVLSAHDRHAISGTPLRLGPRRVLSVSGTAAPGGVVAGQPVELEYLVGRTWLPLGLPVPVSRNGHWRLTYAVARPGSAVVRMRVVMPSQPGLPFAAGASAAFRVAIR